MNKIMTKKTTETEGIPVTAAGGVVYRQKEGKREGLLIYKNDCWDLPKGHQDGNESIEHCAVREVTEETGVGDPVIEQPLPTTVHSYQREGKTYRKTTYWFRMRAKGDEPIKPQETEGIEQVKWVPACQAQDKVGYRNLK